MKKGAAWLKVYARDLAIIQSIPPEAVGKGLTAALKYFTGGEVPELTPQETVVYLLFKASADESLQDYERAVEAGKKGGAPTHKNRGADLVDKFIDGFTPP